MSGGVVIRSRTALMLYRLADWLNGRAIRRDRGKTVGLRTPHNTTYPIAKQKEV